MNCRMKYRRGLLTRALSLLEKTLLAAIETIRVSSFTLKRGEIRARGVAVVLISLALVLRGYLLVALVWGERIQAPESGDHRHGLKPDGFHSEPPAAPSRS
jgi:hypothetical protein